MTTPTAISSTSAIPTTMRAWQYTTTNPGGLSKNLHLNPSAPVPKLSPGSSSELLIRVLATSLNPADYKVPELLDHIPSPVRSLMVRMPASPCLDFCGVVVASSPKVDSFAVGDRVFGRLPSMAQHGATGEFIVAPTNGCGHLPNEGITPEQAATIPCAGVTAYQCIAPHVKAGDKVFINGGSGGTGTFGIQIAKALGCFVTTTCSTGKVESAKALGADEVIDYTKMMVAEEMKKRGKVYALCVDNVGGSTPEMESDLYKSADEYLAPKAGRYVQVGTPFSALGFKTIVSRLFMPSLLGGGKSKMDMFTLKVTKTEDLETLARWVVEGKLKPVVEEVFGFEHLVEAFDKIKTGRCAGKIVVRIGQE